MLSSPYKLFSFLKNDGPLRQKNQETVKHLFIIAAIFVSTASVLASEAGDHPVHTTAEVRNQISRAITFPENLTTHHETEIVLVSFRIESCGLVTILESNTSNPEFEAYVLRKLEGLSVSKGEEHLHHMRFTFKSNG